jgi:hypothetical protein
MSMDSFMAVVKLRLLSEVIVALYWSDCIQWVQINDLRIYLF